MQRSKFSYLQDIKNDFKFIHIDTSLNPNKKVALEEKIARLKELYEYCHKVSKKLKKKVFFELGWESENGEMHDVNELKKFIQEIVEFCKKKKISKPKFITLKTGTKVFEDRNIGQLYKNFKKKKIFKKKLDHLRECIMICHKYGFLVKEHNSDYLSDNFLKLRPKLNIDGVNIAPEFGTLETKTIMNLQNKVKLKNDQKELIKFLVKSKKWNKWTNKNSGISEKKKAILAGHYMFCSKKFIKLKKKLKIKLKKDFKIELDTYLQDVLINRITRIAKSLNLN